MKKKNNKGFMLVETLIATIFVSSILIFLFIQFRNISNSYDESFDYNTVEDLYALNNVKKYIESDSTFLTYIETNIEQNKYIDITNCDLFTEKDYCLKLFSLENIDKIFITTNKFDKSDITNYNDTFLTFISKINKEGNQKYRIVASFNNKTFATLRFGDENE